MLAKVKHEEVLPDGSKIVYFEDGTREVLSVQFLRRIDKIRRNNPTVGRKSAKTNSKFDLEIVNKK